MHWRERRRPKDLLALVFVATLGCGGLHVPATQSHECRGGKIWHPDDIARLRGCHHIAGDLFLGGALTDVTNLGDLTSVGGDLVIGPSYQLNNLSSLAAVVSIEGDLRVEGNWLLQGLFLEKLERVGGGILVTNNPGLKVCVFPTLQSFAALEVRDNRNLERIDMRGLDEKGPVGDVRGRKLEEVAAPARVRWQRKGASENPAKGS